MRLQSNLPVFSGKLDTAPIIDVVFLLLIFLALSSSFVFYPGLPVDIRLPPVESARMHTTEKIVVLLTRNGDIYLNDTPIQWDNLEKHLTDVAFESKAVTLRRMNQPDEELSPARAPKVLLRADSDVPYGHVVRIMAMARSLNLGVYLATDPESSK